MHVPDRLWWVTLPLAGFVVISVPLVYASFALLLVLSGLPYSPSWQVAAARNLAYLPIPVLAGFAVVAVLVTALCCLAANKIVRLGLTMRAHHHLRLRALAGDVTLIPLSRSPEGSASLPDLIVEPLELLWQAKPSAKIAVPCAFFVLFLQWATIPLLAVAVCIPAASALLAGQAPSVGQVASALVGLFAVLVIVVLVVKYVRYQRGLLLRQTGVVADDTGITEYKPSGQHVTVLWGEAHLFEVEGDVLKGTDTPRFSGYALYGPRGSVSWSGAQPRNTNLEPVGTSPGEMALRADALCACVIARTGLQPRTFSPTLMASAEQAGANTSMASAPKQPRTQPTVNTMKRAPHPTRGAVVFLACLVLINVVVLVVVLLPLPIADGLNSRVLDAIAAIAPALSLVLCLGMLAFFVLIPRRSTAKALLTILTPGRARERDSTHSPDGSLTWDERARYTLPIGPSPIVRRTIILFGLALLTAWVPAGALCWAWLHPLVSGIPVPWVSSPPPLVPMSTGADALLDPARDLGGAYVYAMYGICGLLMAVVGTRFRGGAIRADTRGLSTDIAGAPLTVPWEHASQVVALTRDGQVTLYIVRDAQGAVLLSWPAQSGFFTWIGQPSPIHPANRHGEGTFQIQPVTATQLAALVAQRAGATVIDEDAPTV